MGGGGSKGKKQDQVKTVISKTTFDDSGGEEPEQVVTGKNENGHGTGKRVVRNDGWVSPQDSPKRQKSKKKQTLVGDLSSDDERDEMAVMRTPPTERRQEPGGGGRGEETNATKTTGRQNSGSLNHGDHNSGGKVGSPLSREQRNTSRVRAETPPEMNFDDEIDVNPGEVPSNPTRPLFRPPKANGFDPEKFRSVNSGQSTPEKEGGIYAISTYNGASIPDAPPETDTEAILSKYKELHTKEIEQARADINSAINFDEDEEDLMEEILEEV